MNADSPRKVFVSMKQVFYGQFKTFSERPKQRGSTGNNTAKENVMKNTEKSVDFEIQEALNKAMALTRSIGKLAELDDIEESDMGLMAEVATDLIQEAYTALDVHLRKVA